MFTALAVILVGIWMIVKHNQLPDHTLTLIFGIIVAVLALIDLVRPYWGNVVHRAPPG